MEFCANLSAFHDISPKAVSTTFCTSVILEATSIASFPNLYKPKPAATFATIDLIPLTALLIRPVELSILLADVFASFVASFNAFLNLLVSAEMITFNSSSVFLIISFKFFIVSIRKFHSSCLKVLKFIFFLFNKMLFLFFFK